jgi:N-acetylglutamate synthase-like GNAT family acetyltransferase
MAVVDQFQGKGIGKQLLAYIEHLAKTKGMKQIFLQARHNAVPFYKSAGYEIIEETFLLFGEIQHFSMEKQLG